MTDDQYGMLLDAIDNNNITFKEALNAIEMAGNDKKFQKDLDEVYTVEVFDDWDHWQEAISI
jgi:hypothetical protein